MPAIKLFPRAFIRYHAKPRGELSKLPKYRSIARSTTMSDPSRRHLLLVVSVCLYYWRSLISLVTWNISPRTFFHCGKLRKEENISHVIVTLQLFWLRDRKYCVVIVHRKMFWLQNCNKKYNQNQFWLELYESEFWLSQLNFCLISLGYLIIIVWFLFFWLQCIYRKSTNTRILLNSTRFFNICMIYIFLVESIKILMNTMRFF